MKRLLAITILMLSGLFAATAQEKDEVKFNDLYSPTVKNITEGQGDLIRFNGKLMFTGNNRYLSSSDVDNAFWKKYNRAQRAQYWGQYLWSLGLTYVATDLIVSAIHPSSANILEDPSLWVGGICALAGGALDFSGWVKLGKLARTYNFGPTRSGGVGLSLNF